MATYRFTGEFTAARPGALIVQYVRFTVTTAGTVTIDGRALGRNGVGGDGELYLFTSTGQRLAFDQDSGAGFDAQITINLPAGEYFVALGEWSGSSGDPFFSEAEALSGVDVNPDAPPFPFEIVVTEGTAVIAPPVGPADESFTDTSGNDTIFGLQGDDTITVTRGVDTVNGGTGNDTLVVDYSTQGGSSVTTLVSPTANSTGGFDGAYSTSNGERVSFTSIERLVITTGLDGGDTIVGISNDDVISTRGGNDTITSAPGAGRDRIDAGAGVDTVSADWSDLGVGQDVVLDASAAAGGSVTIGTGDTERYLRGVENLADFRTGAGNDTIITGTASFNDTISTGAGDDTIGVTAGKDNADGGAGTDTLVVDYRGEGGGSVTVQAPPTANSAGGFDGAYSTSNGRSVTYTSIERLVITTSEGGDTIVGISNDDVITTNGGSDTITSAAGAGRDRIDAGAGTDTVSADWSDLGVGQDVVLDASAAAGGSVTIGTGASERYLRGVENLADFRTGAGNDTVITGKNFFDDTISTGAGDDTIGVTKGRDKVDGSTGIDTLVIDYSNIGDFSVSTATPASGFDGAFSHGQDGSRVDYTSIERFEITTANGGDSITTGSGDDIIRTQGGADTVNAGAGNDLVEGGDGNDTLNGGAGNDRLNGGNGDDTVNGEDGDDQITMAGASAGFDRVDGGAGADTLTVDWSHLSTSVQDYTDVGYADGLHSSGGGVTLAYNNIERLIVTTGSGNDRFTTGTSDDTVVLGAGDDFVDVVTGNDTADGGAGIDGVSVDLSAATTAIDWNLITNSYSGLTGTSFTNFEYFGTITTGSGNDVIVTSTAVQNETINLGAGDDTATVGYGNDVVNGGTGNDTLIIDYSAVTGNISNFSGPTSGADGFSGIFHEPSIRRTDYTGIERFVITTGSGADSITTATGNDVVNTGANNDFVAVGSGLDQADGGNNADGSRGEDGLSADMRSAGTTAILLDLQANTYSGAAGTSFINFEYLGTLTTGGGNDVIVTTDAARNEVINTGDGDDRVTIVRGSDTVNGGSGTDTLVVDYSSATSFVANNFDRDPTVNTTEGGFNGGFFRNDTLQESFFTSIERVEITTGSGNDRLILTTGNDIARTGAGNDTVNVGSGLDQADGGNNADGSRGEDGLTADLRSAGTTAVLLDLQANTYSGAAGTNFTNFEYFGTLTTGGGNDVIVTTGAARDEVINTGAGDDRVTIVRGVDRVNGGTGTDTLVVDYSAATDVVEMDFNKAPTVNTTDGGFDGGFYRRDTRQQSFFTSIDRFEITTGLGNDNIILTGGDDIARTGAGNDTVNAGAGNDRLEGGAGDDTLNGGDGTLDVAAYLTGAPTDGMASQSGTTLTFNSSLGGGTEGIDTLTGIEKITFAGADGQVGTADDRSFAVVNGNVVVATATDTASAAEGNAGTAAINATGNVLDNDINLDADGGTTSADDVERVTQIGWTGATGPGTASGSPAAAVSFGSSTTVQGRYGTLTIASDGTYTYTPDDRANLLKQGEVAIETFTYTADDGSGNPATATLSISVTGINDAPDGADAVLTVNEDAARVLTASDFGFTDVDGYAFNAVVITTLPTDGRLLLNGAAVTVGQAVSAADIAAGGLSFAPDPNENGTSYASFTFEVQDAGPGGEGGENSDQSANTLTFNVTAVNDAPVNSVPGGQVGTEDTNLIFSSANGNAITVGDIDAGSANLSVTLTVANGRLTLSGVSGVTASGNGTGTVTVTGSAAAINAALNGLTYRGNLNFEGTETLTVTTSDGGSSGSGGVLSDQDAIRIVLNDDGRVNGDSANNNLSGGSGADLFILQDGGDDTASGGSGDDGFFFGAALTAADQVDGGDGRNDQLGIQGNYNLTLGANNLVNVETLAILSSQDNRFGGGSGSSSLLFNYNLTTVDANVAAGRNLVVNSNGLRAGENLVFDGSAEADGSFTTFAGFGTDTLTGGAGNDGFFFGEAGRFTAADRVNGGAGTNDQLGLRGDYSAQVVFDATTIQNVEVIALLSARDVRFGAEAPAYSYNLRTHDGNLAAGQTLTVTGAQLAADETLTFDGSSETDGSFRLMGGRGGDVLTGGGGADTIWGGLGADRLTGGEGADTFLFNSALESTSLNFDAIVGFDYRVDRIDLPGSVSGFAGEVQGTLTRANFDLDLAAALDGILGPNSAAVFTVNGGDAEFAGRTFAVIDANGDGSYQAGQDFVIEIVNPVVPIVPTTEFFV